MLTIEVRVNGCEIELSQPTVASGTWGKAVLNFSFDSEWASLAKTAVLNTPRGNLLVPLENDGCVLPVEVLSKAGTYKLGVFGTDGECTISTHFCSLSVAHGAFCKGTHPINLSPSLYEQFSARFARLENMTATATLGEEASATLIEKDGKAVLSLVLPRGEKGEDYSLTDADKDEIAGIATRGIEAAIDEIIALQEQFLGGSV